MSLISSGNTLSLTDKFDVLKDIGDGSFGSVVLAKVRSAGSSVARRGSVVRIHFYSFLWRDILTVRTGCNQDDEEDI